MNKEIYKNMHGDVFTFTLDEDGNILCEGDFKWCRFGFEYNNPDDLIMVDPSGGPYIDIGTDMGRFNKDWEGKVVTGFVHIETGYKLTIH